MACVSSESKSFKGTIAARTAAIWQLQLSDWYNALPRQVLVHAQVHCNRIDTHQARFVAAYVHMQVARCKNEQSLCVRACFDVRSHSAFERQRVHSLLARGSFPNLGVCAIMQVCGGWIVSSCIGYKKV